MNIEELRAHHQNRVGRLEALHAAATDEHRELTDAEQERVALLRSDINRLSGEIQAAENPQMTNAELAESVRRSMPVTSAVHGGRDLNNPLSEGDETSIRRAALDIAAAVAEGQPIRRAITLPVGFHGGNAAAGEPTDVMDLARYFTTGTVATNSHDAVVIDATDGVIVAEGAPKPDIVTATLKPAPVVKIGGLAVATTEALMFVGGAAKIIEQVLRESIIAGQNAQIATTLTNDADAFPFATSGLETILGASAVIGTRSTASVAIVNPADYAGLVMSTAALPQSLAIPQIVISEDVVVGSAIVAARSAVEIARTPVMILIDPYTLADVNKTRLVAEMFVAVNVIRPSLVLLSDLTATVAAGANR